MVTTATEWLEKYAGRLGIAPPAPEELEQLLALAGTAAHASERIAAPLSCWLAAASGVTTEAALTAARQLAAELEEPPQRPASTRSGQE
ncbi:MAG: hypothetical protein JWM85_2882 [Acidimicrobiaceae bacterium]|nr:hypothetical protein [Acidimicrobiaceae bacterium]